MKEIAQITLTKAAFHLVNLVDRVSDQAAYIRKQSHFLDPKSYPDYLRGHRQLMGVFAGGCIYDQGFGQRDMAHCHFATGVICLSSASLLFCERTMKHEICHLLAPTDGHGRKWLDKLIELNCPNPLDEFIYYTDKPAFSQKYLLKQWGYL